MSSPMVLSDQVMVESKEAKPQIPAEAAVLRAQAFGMTHAGKVRTNNEDQFLVAVLDKALRVQYTSLPKPKTQHSSSCCQLFVVADGMGGHAAGEQASALAINSVEDFVLETFEWFARFKAGDGDQVLAEFQKALGQANARVLSEAHQHPEWRGMGTTLTLALSLNDNLYIAHAGDSRCYLFRAGALYRLTTDHTFVSEMTQRGILNAEEAAHHRWRHMITNVVGGDRPELKVEVHKLGLEAGDRILLCSDGLTEMVTEAVIAEGLAQQLDPEAAAQNLIRQALEAGGKDNVTIIVARFDAETAT